MTSCSACAASIPRIYQSIFSGVLQGEVATLPWNNTPIPLVLGVEYREDEINSMPNEVAREGLLIAYFRDGGAVGKRDIKELFFETELQLLEGCNPGPGPFPEPRNALDRREHLRKRHHL